MPFRFVTFALFLSLLAACAGSPTPAPAPAPAPVVSVPAAPPTPVVASTPPPTKPAPTLAKTRYALRGQVFTENHCDTDLPSAVAISITLANAQHEEHITRKRVGLYGSFYALILDWPDSYGPPTEWRGLKLEKFDGDPICGTCKSGHCTDQTLFPAVPAKSGEDFQNLTIRCGCTDAPAAPAAKP